MKHSHPGGSGPSPAIHVLIAAESPIVRLGLRTILAGSGLDLAGEAESTAEAAARVASLAPEVVLLSARGGELGCRTVEELRRVAPGVPIVIISDEAGDLRAVVHEGVSCLSSRATAAEIVAAVEDARQGRALVDRAAVARVIANLSTGGANGAPTEADRLRTLTPRERQVLALIAQGRSNRQIATALGLSVGTVKVHVGNILTKLQVQDRVQAAVLAVRNDSGAGRSRPRAGEE